MSRLLKKAALPIAVALTVAAPERFRAAADGHASEGATATPWNTEGVPAANTGTTVESITVHGPSLVGNLAGDSPDRRVIVYLPPSYGERTNQRYPVVYLLHGYGGGADVWERHRVPEDMNKAFASGAREMIVVAPDARTIYDGSIYSNSVTIGDWESFIADDLVRYVDSHYRTIASRDGRGIAGFSMGGYGTLRIAMKRPDAFSAAYAMSSCCLTPTVGLRPSTDLEKVTTREEAKAVERRLRTSLAFAAAWAPNPNRPPLYFDTPTRNGEPQPDVIAALNANAGLTLVHQYVPALKRLRALGLEIGLQDGLLASNERMHALLESYKVEHSWETYEGDHGNRLPERIETRMVPFFSKHLASR
jgi:enterochelin esterase-like enzyme